VDRFVDTMYNFMLHNALLNCSYILHTQEV